MGFPVANSERDCSRHVGSAVGLYKQYAQWLRTTMSHAPGRDGVPTAYLAYDDQSGPMADNLERTLRKLRANNLATSIGSTATLHPARFVVSYGMRVDSSFSGTHARGTKERY
ncbi:hypothetical protein JKF63_07564 [Porcisia hertigi]|uniref:Uncharacterized protein n=1 Tax=Porcisia hertigi TaxID=2761500 RepID=A0A836YGG7_9TRYP|nr:hypothetical protein JKF63_07564 [Porcisia hertigi]